MCHKIGGAPISVHMGIHQSSFSGVNLASTCHDMPRRKTFTNTNGERIIMGEWDIGGSGTWSREDMGALGGIPVHPKEETKSLPYDFDILSNFDESSGLGGKTVPQEVECYT